MVTKYNATNYGNFNELQFKPRFIHKNLKSLSHDIISTDEKIPKRTSKNLPQL